MVRLAQPERRDQALRRQVEAGLDLLRAEDESIMDQMAWWMRERMFKVAEDYLSSEEPDVDAMVELRQELRLLGDYRLEVDGFDPWADNRATWVDLLGRIVGRGPLGAVDRRPSKPDLATEVRDHLVRTYQRQAELMAQGVGPPEGKGPEAGRMAAKTAAIWDAWLADPAHPNVKDLTWLRLVVDSGREFFAAREGGDPMAAERAEALALLDRMLGQAR
jgi:hypothetical protein